MEGMLFGFTPLFDIEAKRIGYIGIWFDANLLKESLLLRSTLLPRNKALPSLPYVPELPKNPTHVMIR